MKGKVEKARLSSSDRSERERETVAVAVAEREKGDRVPKLDLAYRGRRKYFDVRLALPMLI